MGAETPLSVNPSSVCTVVEVVPVEKTLTFAQEDLAAIPEGSGRYDIQVSRLD